MFSGEDGVEGVGEVQAVWGGDVNNVDSGVSIDLGVGIVDRATVARGRRGDVFLGKGCAFLVGRGTDSLDFVNEIGLITVRRRIEDEVRDEPGCYKPGS